MPDNTAMTVDADLATLRRGLVAARDFLNRLPLNDGASKQAIDREFIGVKLIPEGLLAADRVEAELSRLREEDAGYARTIVALWEKIAPGESYEELGGATIVELATRLRHTANNLLEGLTVACEEWERDYRAAEARCARLQQALAKIRDSGPRPRTIRSDLAYVILLQGIAREALAGPDTPADSQEFTPSRAPVDPPIVLPADSQEDIDGETWGLMQGGGRPEEPT